jgi:Zn finger protein HypA/HybF involved in hydrogenase expression
MKHWWCMGCDHEVRLGKHGQCEVCGSEAVDLLPTDEAVSCSTSTTNRGTEHSRVCVGASPPALESMN